MGLDLIVDRIREFDSCCHVTDFPPRCAEDPIIADFPALAMFLSVMLRFADELPFYDPPVAGPFRID